MSRSGRRPVLRPPWKKAVRCSSPKRPSGVERALVSHGVRVDFCEVRSKGFNPVEKSTLTPLKALLHRRQATSGPPLAFSEDLPTGTIYLILSLPLTFPAIIQ